MERYNKITNKNPREIVLLKGKPCAWGKCRFCDYIDDNSRDIDTINDLNYEILSRVTGELGVLESYQLWKLFRTSKRNIKNDQRYHHRKADSPSIF